MSLMPSPKAITQGVIVTIAAGLIAAWVLSQFPALRRYVNGQGAGGCRCNG